MLSSLYLHSCMNQTGMLINGMNELASVQLVKKFLVIYL